MVAKSKKLPDYEERSKEIAELVEMVEADYRKEINKDLVQSVRGLIELTRSSDPSIALKAIKEHLLLAGLYEDKEPKSKFSPIQIFLPHQDGGKSDQDSRKTIVQV